jgi:iron complex transport system substrate-binding protein
VVLVAAGGNHGDMISPERLAESFPFLAESPAATEGRFANIDLSQFLTFGPRTGEAALQLHEIIYQ